MMSMAEKTEIDGHQFFGKANLTKDRQKYYHLHIPIGLANLLRITDNDEAKIYVNVVERQILVRVSESE